jgi:hypothetical protein
VDSIITRLAAWLLLPLACPAGASGNVASLVNGVPESPPDDAFNIADLLLIIRKAVHAVSY